MPGPLVQLDLLLIQVAKARQVIHFQFVSESASRV
jgi:hypothetical protein